MMTQLIFIVFLYNCAETGLHQIRLGIKLLVLFLKKITRPNLLTQTLICKQIYLFFKLLFYIGLQLINNVVIVSGVQQSDLVVHFPI